jgi:1-acyl-sn-glycerol-3-phosphate acyltransferase
MEPTEQAGVSRRLKFVQALLGFFACLALALPYLRRTHGLKRLEPRRHHLFVSNHVSLLDTILLGGLLWRSGNYPILVLGDKNVWRDSWIRSALSKPIGFLLERGRLNPGRIRELQQYANEIKKFQLVVFPEGTRGNGVDVAECQPGIFYIAQESRAPIVPVFIENMQLVSTKTGRFHPLGGLRKIEVHFGEPIPPENYLSLPRGEFLELMRQSILAARLPRAAAHPVAPAAELSSSNPPTVG